MKLFNEKNINRIAIILGYTGRVLVYIGLICACILMWTLIINIIL